MNAKEYSDSLFGRVVDFDEVQQDYLQYAKVFACGSPALEKSLLTLWDYGFKTIACGNGYDERLENFSLESEQNIQSRYNSYLSASGLQKIYMNMRRDDYIPRYHGYISIDINSIESPRSFTKNIVDKLKPFKKELSFNVKQGQTDGKASITIFLSVHRNKPSIYQEICLSPIEPEKALSLSLPEKTTFDKYFEAIISAIEDYSSHEGREKGVLEQMKTYVNIMKDKSE